MKKLILFLIMPLGFIPACGQKTDKSQKYSMGAQYAQEFVLDGYVRVREWELAGDKMNLKDLGMSNYPAVQIYVKKNLNHDRTLTLAYDHYFMRGTSTFDRNIVYNGTIIDGRKGIDVSPTRYFRATLTYRGKLLKGNLFDLGYMAGLVFDHIKFYLDGEVVPGSLKSEVYEGFGRQAFPYPFAGLNANTDLGESSRLNLEISGTYIPEFKSFYTEGGHVNLQYSLFQTDLNYSHAVSDFEMVIGARLRYMHLFQESLEDTNILSTFTGGPYIGISYDF